MLKIEPISGGVYYRISLTEDKGESYTYWYSENYPITLPAHLTDFIAGDLGFFYSSKYTKMGAIGLIHGVKTLEEAVDIFIKIVNEYA